MMVRIGFFMRENRIGQFIYFDPLGKVCTNRHILKYMFAYTDEVYENNVSIQSLLSNYCGLYCIAYLIHVAARGRSTHSFNVLFSKENLQENDFIVTQYILNNNDINVNAVKQNK